MSALVAAVLLGACRMVAASTEPVDHTSVHNVLDHSSMTSEEIHEEMLHSEDRGIALMTLTSLGIVMGVFYLVKSENTQMRVISWKVISSTISIIIAVMLFKAPNTLLEQLVYEHHEDNLILVLLPAIAQLFCWLALLRLSLAVIVRTYKSRADLHSAEHVYEELEVNLMSVAQLLGHVSAFAAILVFNIVQDMIAEHIESRALAFLALLCVPLGIWIGANFLSIASRITEQYAPGMREIDHRAQECCSEIIVEVEDDLVGLVVSYQFVRAILLSITGSLPDREGAEPERALMGHKDSGELLALGIVTGGLLLFNVMLRLPGTVRRFQGRPTVQEQLRRVKMQMGLVVPMATAWCMANLLYWCAALIFSEHKGMRRMTYYAVASTILGLGLIFLLKRLTRVKERSVKKAVLREIKALALLISFAWERHVDHGVKSLVEGLGETGVILSQLVRLVLLAILVAPAWRWYVLPTLLHLEEEEAEAEAEKARLSGEGDEVEKGSDVEAAGAKEQLSGAHAPDEKADGPARLEE